MSVDSTSIRSPRVPQQDRSRATQQRILDAAAQVLTEVGYEGFTTGSVSTRAGVSQGSLFGHFPRREVLLAATVEHLVGGQRERFSSVAEAMQDKPVRDQVRALIRALWNVQRDPGLLAMLQVFAAARTNDKLADALRPIATETVGTTHAAGVLLLTSLGVSPDARVAGLVGVLFYALEGMAQDEKIAGPPAPDYYDQAFWHLERLIMSLIDEE
ncbi:MAG: TetR/AcrR family transcriptional regulator [Myxococcota bacterium]